MPLAAVAELGKTGVVQAVRSCRHQRGDHGVVFRDAVGARPVKLPVPINGAA